MFQFLFKFPHAVFARGQIVFLAPWPSWILWTLIAAGVAGLAALIVWYLPGNASGSHRWRAGVIWLLQSLLLALLLTIGLGAVWITALEVGQELQCGLIRIGVQALKHL